MADELSAAPPELREVSSDLDDVRGRMADVMSSLRAKLDAEGDAWGNDHIGNQFANGANGYLAQLKWVQGSVDAKADLLGDYAGKLRYAANSFEQTDQA